MAKNNYIWALADKRHRTAFCIILNKTVKILFFFMVTEQISVEYDKKYQIVSFKFQVNFVEQSREFCQAAMLLKELALTKFRCCHTNKAPVTTKRI